MRITTLLFLLAIYGPAFAQEDVEVTINPGAKYDSARWQYIRSFPDHFFIWPVLKQRKLDFTLESLPGRRNGLEYKSNKPYSFGVGMYLFELGFELAFAVPLDEQSKRIYGESDARDIQLNILGKKWGLDAYTQKYSGFYIADSETQMPANIPYPQRPDIDIYNRGITGHYIFNHKKFSFRSVYNFAERQLQSGGSPVLFSTLNTFKASADSAIIADQYASVFGSGARIQRIKTTMLGMAPGYAYNLIYKGFFLNGTLAIGPAHNWLAYEADDGTQKDDINFSLFVTARLALGYNGDRFFGGLSFINQGRSTKFDDFQLTNSNSTFKILFGYRFEEFGFLEKRVSDIPKALRKAME